MRWLFLPLVALAACRTTTLPAPPPVAAWEVPILLEPGSRPLVQVTVGSTPTRFVVDTGASETVLYAWFAKSIGADHELQLQVGTNALDSKVWPVVDAPAGLEALGIGGVLSPQQAATKGAIVLDFPHKRLVAVGEKLNTWLRWLDERSPKGTTESLPRVGPRDGKLYVMSRVGDGKEVVTQLDTGSLTTEFATSIFDPSLLTGKPLEGLHVRLGDSDFGPLSVTTQPTPGGAEGKLGLDVLAGVVVLVPIVGYQALWVMTPRE